MKDTYILKTNGKKELYNPDKFHKKLNFALEGLKTLSASEIEMNAASKIINGSTSKEIQEALISSTADMISENLPEAQIASARLLNQDIRKTVWGSFEPQTLLETIDKNIKEKIYDGTYLFEHYTREEIKELQKHIDYNRDDKFVYSGLKGVKDSYLIRKNGEIKETPQEMFMLINMFAFAKYPKDLRYKWVTEGYNILSNFEASLPTPIMVQLRSMFRKFISCNIIPLGDTRETLSNAIKSMYMLVSAGAGLGLGAGDIRGLGAIIDNGRMEHTGLQPLMKSYEKSSKAFVQPTRDGSTSAYYPFYHKEIEHILVIGNNKGTENNRVRDMDHAIIFNTLFFERYAKDEDITLFYMNDIPDLQSYNGYPKEFKEKYEYYEKTVPKNRQTKIKASKIFHKFIDERFLQSREYLVFADDFQGHGSFRIPVKTSNLCLAGDTKIDVKENEKEFSIDIKDVDKYDSLKVKSKDTFTNKVTYEDITNFALMSKDSELIRITDIKTGKKIECTLNHKIWTKNRGYIEARNLNEDDVLDIL